MDEHGHSSAELMAALRASRIFRVLDEVILRDLAGELTLKAVNRGTLLLREGAVADSMIIVVSGRLRVSRRNADGTLRLYNEVCPGETVGELGLILEQRRSADVTAVRDSLVCFLYRDRFERLLQRHPIVLHRVFSRALYHQFTRAEQAVEQRRSQTVALIPLAPGRPCSDVARGLASALSKFGRAEHVCAVNGLPENFGELQRRFDYVVCETDGKDTAETRTAFRQTDQVVLLADANGEPSPAAIEARLAAEPDFPFKRRHLLLLHQANAAMPVDPKPWVAVRDIERCYPMRLDRVRDYQRVARFLASRAVGVVLGGGGARGFSHLGVLRALEESGVPVDLIGGNSVGALIGAQYACDVPLDEIMARTRRFALGGERPALPIFALLSGKRIARDLYRMFEDRLIERLWHPFFATACNLSQVETTVLDSGLVWKAVLASNSPAGLLPPVVHNGDLLVDNAILDNVPVLAMRTRLGTPLEQRGGNGTVVAVDVDVAEKMALPAGVSRLSAFDAVKAFLLGHRSPPNIGAILYRAGHVGSLHHRGRTIAQADHYLEPPVKGFPLMAYRRAEEIVEVGYRHALQEIARWKTLPGRH